MVQKIFALLNKEVGSVQHAAYILAGASFLSQILALFRDRIFASLFGAGKELDLYYAAFRIPDILYVAVSALISVSVIVPLLVQAERKDAEGQTGSKYRSHVDELIAIIFTAFVWLVVVLSALAFVLMPHIIPALFPKFNGDIPELVTITRILLLSPILLGLSNIFSAIVQVSQRFFITALSPVVYNLGIIFGAVFLSPTYGIQGAVYGVIAGAVLHVIVQLPYLISIKKIPSFSFYNPLKILHQARSIVLTSLPRTVSLSIAELVEFVLVIVAGYIGAGSIAVFTLAWNLQSVPLSLIGVSFSVALFPTLSKLFTAQNDVLFREKFFFTIRQVTYFGSIAAVLSIVLRAQIVRTAFGAGVFDWNATRLTAAAFALFVVSLVFQSLVLVMTRTWYARGSTSKPLISNAFAGLITGGVLVGLLYAWKAIPSLKMSLESMLRVQGLSGTEVLILPLAFSIGALCNAILLIYTLRGVVKGWKTIIRPCTEHLSGALIMGVVAYGILQLFADYVDTSRTLGVFLHGAIAGTIGLAVGFAFLFGIGNVETRHILDGLKRRKATVITENEPV